jgi:hypothetical protein
LAQQQHRHSMSSLRADAAVPFALQAPPRPIGPGDSSRLTPRQRQAAAEASEEEALGEPSTDVEVRIADLALKIDRLTELVVALQAQQSRRLDDVSVA